MSDVRLTYDRLALIAGSFTLTPGVGFSQGVVEGPQGANLRDQLLGDLAIEDGKGGSILLEDLLCLTTDEIEAYEGDGALRLTLVDERMEWRFGSITGRYNVLRDDRRTFDPDTINGHAPHKWRTLVKLCLKAAGLSGRFKSTSALRGVRWTPTDIEWDHDPPMMVLQRDLLEPLGMFLVLQHDRSIEIHQMGKGSLPPDGELERRPLSRSNKVASRPSKIRIVGARHRKQEITTAWIRCLPHDGFGKSGSSSSAIADVTPGQVMNYEDVIRDWGMTTGATTSTHASYAVGALRRNPFENYTAGGALNEQRKRTMGQWLNRFWPHVTTSNSATTVRSKLPMLNKLLQVGSSGIALAPRAACDYWTARNGAHVDRFENRVFTTAAPKYFKSKIIDAHKGVVEILSDLPVGTLDATTGLATVEDTFLNNGLVAIEYAYRQNTGEESDFFTMERDDPRDAEVSARIDRPKRVKVIRRPELAIDFINGQTGLQKVDVETRASAQIAKLWETPLDEEALEYVYHGIRPIKLNGRIRRVTWDVPEDGPPQTLVIVDSDRPRQGNAPDFRDVQDRIFSDQVAVGGERALATRVAQLVEENLIRSKSVRTENGEGGAPEHVPNRTIHTGWLSIIPLTDQSSVNGRIQFGELKEVADGGIVMTNVGPIAQAFFITSQTADFGADHGKWMMPGYYYVRVDSVTSSGYAAMYSCTPISLDGGTTGNPIAEAEIDWSWWHFPRAFQGSYNWIVSTLNALIDAHSVSPGAVPGKLTKITSAEATMDTGDLSLIFLDHEGKWLGLPNTDFKWHVGATGP